MNKQYILKSKDFSFSSNQFHLGNSDHSFSARFKINGKSNDSISNSEEILVTPNEVIFREI